MVNLGKIKKAVGKVNVAKIKLALAYPQYKSVLKEIDNKSKSILLMGTPLHDNLGDHLIALAEKSLLKEFFPDYSIYEIPTEMFMVHGSTIADTVNDDTLVFVSGGGWMGNIWESDEFLMQNIVTAFNNKKIFIFPQTIYYDKEKENYNTVLDKAKNCYVRHENLIISVRDKASYDFALENLEIPKNHLLLLPDVALTYDKKIVNKAENKVALCLRKDCEKSSLNISEAAILQAMKNCKLDVTETDTLIKGFLPAKYREKVVRDKLNEFSKYSFTITDRLHAMVISALVNTPCIAMDNKTGKVKGVYELWLKDKKNVLFAESEEQLLNYIEKIDECYTNNTYCSNDNYRNMFTLIKERMK